MPPTPFSSIITSRREKRRQKRREKRSSGKVGTIKYNWPWELQNEVPGLPKPPLETFWMPKGPLSALGGRGGCLEALGTLPGRSSALWAPGLPWYRTIWGAWGQHLDNFWKNFASQGGVRHENSEKLEFDIPLNEHAMFLRSQAPK